jgi:hypothetical protein
MDQAKLYLMYAGDAGKSFIDRVTTIRATFTPENIQESFLEAIEDVADDLDRELGVPQSSPARRLALIPAVSRRPGIERAVDELCKAVGWLRQHVE